MIDAQVYGYALLRIARGRAIRMHLRQVGHMLDTPVDSTNGGAPVAVAASTTENNEEGQQEDEDEADEELQAIEDDQYPDHVKWLRLMVSPFDAIETVLNFVRSSKRGFQSFSATALLAPQSTSSLFDWRQLIRNSEFFPADDWQDPQSTSATSSFSNESLVTYLERSMESALTAKKCTDLVRTIQQEWSYRTEKPQLFKFTRLTTALKTLETTTPNSKQDLVNVSACLATWISAKNTQRNTQEHANTEDSDDQSSITPTRMDVEALERKITKCFEKLYAAHPLPEGNQFFTSLKQLEFHGAIHCEASLASMVNNAAGRDLYSPGDIEPKLRMEMLVSSLSPCFSSNSHLLFL